ncbi:MAG TPA: GMP synthase (glutamine-hydrolyzing), partial [Deltaproteobacteria bacterium]|nr:GMP synthase (glutamine-hydrolyzing) [Deltaproteobacteria bacterium]
MKESVAVLDFGSQYAQLIARRIRELGVYCEILRHDITRDELVSKSPKALVFSGGPA